MQRRGRSAHGSRRRQPLAQTQSSSDDDSSDSGSVTRCICGEIHNVGLMVQCDKCEVWQHCSCIGLLEQDIPEQYYCEECRPENHSWIKQPNGRSKRQYHPDGSSEKKQQPKRRMTNNSREADVPLAEILMSRAVVNGEERTTGPSDENTKDEVEVAIALPPIVEGIEEAVKRRSRRSVEEAQQAATLAAAASAAAAAATAAAHKRSRSHSTDEEKLAEAAKDGVPEVGLEESDSDIKAKRPRRTGPSGNRSNGDKKPIMPKKQLARKGPVKRTKNARSRTSTPQLSDNEAMPPQQEKVDESSAPAKVRYPSAKMSLWEMNRRAKQILEYISSVQVEMANKPTPLKRKGAEDGCSFAHLDVPASPASSVSSATTLPLDSQTNNEDSTEQSSLEIMDRLTRELIKFQNKFSTSSYHHHPRLPQALDQLPTAANASSSAEDHSLPVPSATASHA
ncbi:unnamed protein product [Umbelopsis ramanniana]